MRVESAVGVERHAPQRQPGGEHRGEPCEPAGQVAVGVGDRALVAGASVGGRERGERAAHAVDLGRHLARAGADGIPRREVAECPECLEGRLEHRIADAADPEPVVLRLLDRGDRHARGGDRRREVPVQAQPLQRVRVGPRDIEVAAHPPEAGTRVECADLPEVAAREVRLVGMVVADRREDCDLPLAVQSRESRGGRAPPQTRVLGEGGPGRGVELQRRPQGRILRVADRSQHAHAVASAGQEEAHEHRLRRPGRRGRDALLECAEAEPLRAVDRQREPRAAREERAAAEAGAGRGRHAGLDRREAATGLGGGLPEELCPGEVAAAVCRVP